MTLLSTFDGFSLSLAGIPARGAVSALPAGHVKQMEKRWDPASEEYAANCADMTCQFEEAEKGKMSLAVKAARNHTAVFSASAARGWVEHDKTYLTVIE